MSSISRQHQTAPQEQQQERNVPAMPDAQAQYLLNWVVQQHALKANWAPIQPGQQNVALQGHLNTQVLQPSVLTPTGQLLQPLQTWSPHLPPPMMMSSSRPPPLCPEFNRQQILHQGTSGICQVGDACLYMAVTVKTLN